MVPLDANPKATRVMIMSLGGEATFGIGTASVANCSIPTQMSEYRSKGTVGNDIDTVGYGLSLSQAVSPNVPEVFMNAVFSGEDLKQTQ